MTTISKRLCRLLASLGAGPRLEAQIVTDGLSGALDEALIRGFVEMQGDVVSITLTGRAAIARCGTAGWSA